MPAQVQRKWGRGAGEGEEGEGGEGKREEKGQGGEGRGKEREAGEEGTGEVGREKSGQECGRLSDLLPGFTLV